MLSLRRDGLSRNTKNKEKVAESLTLSKEHVRYELKPLRKRITCLVCIHANSSSVCMMSHMLHERRNSRFRKNRGTAHVCADEMHTVRAERTILTQKEESQERLETCLSNSHRVYTI